MKKTALLLVLILGVLSTQAQVLDTTTLQSFSSGDAKYKSWYIKNNLVLPVYGRWSADTLSKIPGTTKVINGEIWVVDELKHWGKAVKFAPVTIDTNSLYATKYDVRNAKADTVNLIATKTDLRNVTPDGVVLDTSIFPRKANNLSDIPDKAAARANLGIVASSGGGGSSVATANYLLFDDFTRANTANNVASTMLGTSASGMAWDTENYGVGANTQGGIVNNRWETKATALTAPLVYSATSKDLGQKIVSIGGKFKFTFGDNTLGDPLMIFMAGQLGVGNNSYNAVQFAVVRNYINVTTWVNGSGAGGGGTKTIFFPAGLPRDVDVTAEFTFKGNICYWQVGPYSGSYQDDRLPAQVGNYATFQTYYNDYAGASLSQGISLASVWVKGASIANLDKSISAKTGAKASVTGTLEKTMVYSTTIRANTLGPNGNLRMEWMASWTNNVNVKRVEIELGGVTIGWLESNNTAGWKGLTLFQNRGASNVGIAPHWSNNVGSPGPINVVVYDAANFREINFGIDNLLTFNITLTDATDVASLEALQLYTYY